MKQLIFAVAITILYSSFLIYQQDNNRFQRQYEQLKFVADELAGSAAMYSDESEYGEGKYVFNQVEGTKAIEYQLKGLLHLNDTFVPQSNTYWTEQISYKVYFLDDSNTTYPYIFVDPDTGYTKAIGAPCVVVTINAGKPRYRLSFISPNNAIRSGAYEWKGR